MIPPKATMTMRSTLSALSLLLLLLLPSSCILAVDASGLDGRTPNARRADTVRLLEEKLHYLQEIESRLADSAHRVHAQLEQGVASEGDVRDAEVRLLEARARRVDAELELARWRRLKSDDDDDEDDEEDEDEDDDEEEKRDREHRG